MRSKTLLFITCLVFIISASFMTGVNASRLIDYRGKTVKIGLLIPDNRSIAAIQGAEIAIREANAEGGMDGMQFQLVTRSMEGPWGTGSKEAVDLVFKEQVWAILGSHGGRNAHLAEQVAAKAQLVFLNAWASDPTLSRAFIPWYFSCVPDDFQQADALIEEIYNKRRIDKTAVITGNDYDSKLSSGAFLKKVKTAGESDPLLFSFEDFSQDSNAQLDKINKEGVNCIVLFGQPSPALKIIRQIRRRNMKLAVFGTLQLLNENEISYQELIDYDNTVSVPSGHWTASESSSFHEKFQETYSREPGVVASYAYDGMKMIIEAIRKAAAPDREKIQKALEKIRYNGVTGSIRFDDKGNRTGNFEVSDVKNGLPVLNKKN